MYIYTLRAMPIIHTIWIISELSLFMVSEPFMELLFRTVKPQLNRPSSPQNASVAVYNRFCFVLQASVCSVLLADHCCWAVLTLLVAVLTFIDGCPSQLLGLNHRPLLNKDVVAKKNPFVLLESSKGNSLYNELQNLKIFCLVGRQELPSMGEACETCSQGKTKA